MKKKDIKKVVIGIQGGTFSRGSDTMFHWVVDEKYVERNLIVLRSCLLDDSRENLFAWPPHGWRISFT